MQCVSAISSETMLHTATNTHFLHVVDGGDVSMGSSQTASSENAHGSASAVDFLSTTAAASATSCARRHWMLLVFATLQSFSLRSVQRTGLSLAGG